MKKYLLIIAAITVMAASCQKEDNLSKDGKVTVSLSANVDNNQTKVNYVKDASVYKGSWATGDAVSIIAPNNTNAAFSYKSGNEFTGEVTPWTTASDVYGIYPYSSTAYTITDGKLKDFDASSLTIAAGETNSTSCLMVAKGNGVSDPMPDMSFKQAMAIVRMNITNVPSGVTVTKAAIINQDMYSNLTLVGKADVDMSTGAIDGTPTYTNMVVADITGAAAGANTYVNIPLFPTTTAAKYSFCVTLSNGKVYKKTLSDAKTFAQNTIYTLDYNLSIVPENDLLLMVTYKLDNSAIDISGYGRTMNGGVLAQNNTSLGNINQVSHTNKFPSESDPFTYHYVYCENLFDKVSSGYTIEAWAYPTEASVGSDYKIMSSSAGCGFNLVFEGNIVSPGNNVLTLSQNDNGTYKHPIGPKTVTNKWYHVIGTWDGATIKLYVNDFASLYSKTEVNSMRITPSQGLSIPSTGIGANYSAERITNSLEGFIGTTRLWNRALNDTEIQALFDAAPANPEKP